MNFLKKIMCGTGVGAVLLMCSCAGGQELADNTEEGTAGICAGAAFVSELALTELESVGSADISYGGVIEKTESYFGRYIYLNTEENEIAREEADLTGLSSEGGAFEVFAAADGKAVRYRRTMCGAMGQTEENYYIIGENEVYFTRLEKHYDTYHLSKADILNYVFSEYWIEDGRAYRLDRVNEKLTECGENPVPEQFREIAEN